jgi:hypothetical protein
LLKPPLAQIATPKRALTPDLGGRIAVNPRFPLRNCRVEKRYEHAAASVDEIAVGLLAAGASARTLATDAPLSRKAISSIRISNFLSIEAIKARLLGLRHVQKAATKYRCDCEHRRVKCFV